VTQPASNWLNLGAIVQADGTPLPREPYLNIIGASSIVDNPSNYSTDVTFTALTAPSGTGYVHVTAGSVDSPAAAINLGNSDVTGLLPVANLAIGTNGFVLTMVSGTPEWAATSAAGVTGTGLWFSTTGTLHSAAITLTGDVSQGALSTNNLPLTVVALQGFAVTSATPTSAEILLYHSSAWTPTAVSGDVAISSTGVTTVTALQTFAVSSATPTSAELLLYHASAWTPTAVTGDISISSTGVSEVLGLLGVALPSNTAGILQSTGSAWSLSTVAAASITHGTADQLLDTSHAGTAAEWFTVGGDLQYASHSFTVASIQGIAISGTPASGNVLTATSSSAASWGHVNLASANAITGTLPAANLPTITLTGQVTGSGSAGSIATTLTAANLPAITLTGDCTGSASGGSIATTVGAIQGQTVTSGALVKGDFLIATSTSNWAKTALSGDVSASATSPGSITVTGLQGAALPSLSNGFLQNSSGAWSLASITAAQLPTITLTGQVTGSSSGGSIATTLTSANLPTITHTGDVTGANSGGSIANTVVAIQGNTVTSGALTKGQFLVASSTSNWAATSLSNDVAESASTPGSITVNSGGNGAVTFSTSGNVGGVNSIESNGTNIATGGYIRVSNNVNLIESRNAANSGNILVLATDASNNINLGNVTTNDIQFFPGSNTASILFDSTGAQFFASALDLGGASGVLSMGAVTTAATALPTTSIGLYNGPSQTLTINAANLAFENTVTSTVLFGINALASTSAASGTTGIRLTVQPQTGQAATGASHNGGTGGIAAYVSAPGGTSAAGNGGTGGACDVGAGLGGNATAGTGNGGTGGALNLYSGAGGTTTGGTTGVPGNVTCLAGFAKNIIWQGTAGTNTVAAGTANLQLFGALDVGGGEGVLGFTLCQQIPTTIPTTSMLVCFDGTGLMVFSDGTSTTVFNESMSANWTGTANTQQCLVKKYGKIQRTTNATPATIITVPLPTSSTSVLVKIEGIARQSVTAATSASAFATHQFVNNAGTVTGSTVIHDEVAPWGSGNLFNPVISGTNINIQITGVAATNIDWTVRVEAIFS
jgi:hypothetical protein